MKYRDSAQLDPSQMGSRGRGGAIALGGGAGLVVLVLALVLGLNPNDLLGSPEAGPAPSGSSSAFAQCRRGADIENDRDCRFVAYTNSIQDYWTDALRGDYQRIQVVPFTGQVSTACGTAGSAVGPFYCPGDTTVYLDLGFFDQLTEQLGAKGGDAAEAYVFAHEFGHHIQNLVGTMDKVQSQGRTTGPKSPAVRLELQADCYAGVWFHHATADPASPIEEVSRADLERAADAAAAVGDDRIQERASGQVSPESWTHGSSALRQKWLLEGFRTGDPSRCNTFASSGP
jgi:uncharacterized protein